MAERPGSGGEQQFQGPAVAHALGQVAVAVGMGVDQAGVEQHAAGIDDGGIVGRRQPGASDLGDVVAVDQDVGARCGVGRGVE